MKILKFGGSSLDTPQRVTNAIKIIGDSHRINKQIAVVLSALGAVTDQLIELSSAASKGQEHYHELFEKLGTKHVDFTTSLIKKNQDYELWGVAFLSHY